MSLPAWLEDGLILGLITLLELGAVVGAVLTVHFLTK